jgi:hypothetical protein
MFINYKIFHILIQAPDNSSYHTHKKITPLSLTIMKSSPLNKFKALLTEFFILVTIMLLIPLLMYMDLKILNNEMTELSVTEFAQIALVLASSLIFFKLSYKHIQSKGIFILISGLFAAIFIRELDYYFDLVARHLWKYMVTALFLLVAYSSYLNKKTIFKPLLEFVDTKPFVYFLIGFLMVMAFSRVFGLRDIWQLIMGEQYSHIFKTAIQESLELLGYALVFYSALLTYRDYKIKNLAGKVPDKDM